MPGNSTTPIVQADADGITRAAALLTAGALVAVPTETVYGLAARADNAKAVAAIYAAKGRPDFNPLIVHVADLPHAERLGEFDARAQSLASAFWPGPLTLVVPRRRDAALAKAVTAGLSTVALRCPAHPAMQALLAATGLPLAAPSANRSGMISPTSADHVAATLDGRIALILDGGPCTAGIESTIVAVRPKQGWSLLRPGPIQPSAIAAVLGENESVAQFTGPIEAPGQLASHYAPGKPMRLHAVTVEPDEFHIGFGKIEGQINLSHDSDLTTAAANIYAALHIAKAALHPRIAVAPIPASGLGVSINDRLRRAATDPA